MNRAARVVTGIAALVILCGANDPNNPTCPATPDWGPAARMTLNTRDENGMRVLVAEGIIDSTLPDRLKRALDADENIGEVWLRSRGGDARAPRRGDRLATDPATPTAPTRSAAPATLATKRALETPPPTR